MEVFFKMVQKTRSIASPNFSMICKHDRCNYLQITNKYRTEYEHECKVAEKLNQDGVDDCKEIKTYRCLIQEMLYQGATNGEITSQVSTFLATVRLTLK